MPIPMIDTSINNKTFGPWIRKGMEKGLEKGMEKGLEKGLVKGAQRALHLALKQRFGALPSAIDRQVRKLTAGQAEELLVGVLDGKSLEELFPAAAKMR